MADNKHPPYVSVEYIQKSSNPVQESNTIQPGQAGTPPPVNQEPAASVESSQPESAPPVQVDSTEAQAGLEQIGSSDVIVRGVAALTMANMLDMEYVWNLETGEPMTIAEAKQSPHLAFIDFDELQERSEDIDPTNVAELIAALPAQKSKRNQMIDENAKIAYTKGAAGPGVTVKQIPGIVRVEVTGPVTLQKARQGDVRILQVKYKTVETPTGFAGVEPQPVQVKRAHVPGPHAVTTRRHQQKRTVPRIPPPVSELPKEEPTPEPEEFVDEDYTF